MLAHTYYLRDPRVRREAEALAELGVEVHVISLAETGWQGKPEPRRSNVNGVEVHRLPIRRKRGSALRYLYEYGAMAVLGCLKLTALHLRARLSAVHIHNMPDILVFAGLLPRLTGSKLVLDVHDPMPELFLSWHEDAAQSLTVKMLRLQEKVSCRVADRVISVNETMRENLQKKGIPDEKIYIVHNFPDERLFPMSAMPTSWPKSRECLNILYCGTVTKHYDVGLAVKAIARLKGELPVTLKIMGEGNRLSEVLDLASQLGVRDRVEHIGLAPADRVREEMKKADIGISCHWAGIFGDLYFSTKIIEYLSQGLPVVSPQTYTIAKYLPPDCMFYFQSGDDAGLAETLRFMWNNPSAVLQRVANARQLLPRFSWQAEKTKFQSFYSNFLSQEIAEAQVAGGR